MNNEIFDFVYAMAIRAATNRVAGSSRYNNILKSTKTNGPIKRILKNYIDNIIIGKNCNFYQTVNDIETELAIMHVTGVSFGQIQKIINLTSKYFYITTYNSIGQSIVNRNNFNVCHCPLDAKMRDFVFDEIKKISSSSLVNNIFVTTKTKSSIQKYRWSQLTRQQQFFYDDFQQCVEALRQHENLLNKLEYDYVHWQP